MAKIILTPNEFANMVMIYLFNKFVKNKDYLSEYKMFHKAMEDMRSRGGATIAMRYYLDLDSEQRLKFKRIEKAVFGETNEIGTLTVIPDITKKKEKGFLSRIKDKILKKEDLDIEEIKLIIESMESMMEDESNE